MNEKEPHQPSPEEIEQAESHLTEAQKVQSERRAEIEGVIKGHLFWAEDAAYSDFYEDTPDFYEYYEEWERFLRETADDLKGSTLIDIGCGFKFKNICKIAEKQGVAKYVGVEPFANVAIYDPDKPESGGVVFYSKEFSEVLPRWKKKEGLTLDIEIVEKEGLEYLFSLPDNSANITINGMDESIVRARPARRENRIWADEWTRDSSGNLIASGWQYFDYLAQEIARVIGKDHICFGIQSWPVFKALGNQGLKTEIYREGSKYPITVCRQEQQVTEE